MWRYHTGLEKIYSAAVIDSAGTLYVCSNDGLFAINPDGSLKWELRGIRARTSPVLDFDGTVYVCSTDGKLYAIGGRW